MDENVNPFKLLFICLFHLIEKRNFAWTAEAYHAGLQPPRRRSIQKQFMTGNIVCDNKLIIWNLYSV